jgi:glycerol-3-phosphate dehydrogenase
VSDVEVAVIGGGVVGAGVAYALARRGVRTVVLEAEDEPARGASGSNSGILHTGFDSKRGELETDLILRAAQLRPPVVEQLGIPIIRCGARLAPHSEEEAETIGRLAAGAMVNGVEVDLAGEALVVLGESVTDPVAFTHALLAAAAGERAEVRTGAPATGIRRRDGRLIVQVDGGPDVVCSVAINCAGLHADDVARLAGDDTFGIYPRKGEFFVFDPPEPLEQILLPVPTERTKGVLVFPTTDGKVIAGPTAVDGDDKTDWSVRDDAFAEVMAKARAMWPPLEGAEPITAYAGLRPAGRDGGNYMIGASRAAPGLVNVAAIRSTGLTASLGIGEHVVRIAAELGVVLGPDRPLAPRPVPESELPWWRRAAIRTMRPL